MEGDPLRSIRANDPGPFTLDGTWTHIVGHTHAVVIDPGPDMDDHVRAVLRLVENAERVTVLTSHGHGDHVGAVDALLRGRPDAEVIGHGHAAARPPEAGEVVESEAGALHVIPTPGHTADHLCFHWPARRTLFAADMVLGEGDTTWVAEYSGCVADWLDSLENLSRLDLDRVLSAHGPPIDDPPAMWERYRAHRISRIAAARAALEAEGLEPGNPRTRAQRERVFDRVYGDTVPSGLRGAAAQSLAAVLEYVDSGGAAG